MKTKMCISISLLILMVGTTYGNNLVEVEITYKNIFGNSETLEQHPANGLDLRYVSQGTEDYAAHSDIDAVDTPDVVGDKYVPCFWVYSYENGGTYSCDTPENLIVQLDRGKVEATCWYKLVTTNGPSSSVRIIGYSEDAGFDTDIITHVDPATAQINSSLVSTVDGNITIGVKEKIDSTPFTEWVLRNPALSCSNNQLTSPQDSGGLAIALYGIEEEDNPDINPSQFGELMREIDRLIKEFRLAKEAADHLSNPKQDPDLLKGPKNSIGPCPIPPENIDVAIQKLEELKITLRDYQKSTKRVPR